MREVEDPERGVEGRAPESVRRTTLNPCYLLRFHIALDVFRLRLFTLHVSRFTHHVFRLSRFTQRFKQVAQFLLDRPGTGHRLRNLGAHQLAAPAAQPMDGHFDRAFGQAQRGCQRRIGGGARPATKESFSRSNCALFPDLAYSACNRAMARSSTVMAQRRS